MLVASMLLQVFLLLLALLLLASMLLSILTLLLAPLHLLVFLLLLALLLLALVHYECCSMISLLLLFFLRPCQKGLLDPRRRPFTLPYAENSGPSRPGLPPGAWLVQTFPAFGNAKGLLPGTRRVFWHGGMWKYLLVAGKISRYEQQDCLTLVMEFSDGKLKQKGFFHSAYFIHIKITS